MKDLIDFALLRVALVILSTLCLIEDPGLGLAFALSFISTEILGLCRASSFAPWRLIGKDRHE